MAYADEVAQIAQAFQTADCLDCGWALDSHDITRDGSGRAVAKCLRAPRSTPAGHVTLPADVFDDLLAAAKQVAANWEQGDLAGAVSELEAAGEMAEAEVKR